MRITKQEVAELVKAAWRRGYLVGLDQAQVRLEQDREKDQKAEVDAGDLIADFENAKAAKKG